MSARAECTWGDGPDVLVIVERANTSGHNWMPYELARDLENEGSFGLTVNEALALAAQLVQSAVTATRLDAGYMEAGRSRAAACAEAPREGAVSLILNAEKKLLVVWNRRFHGWTLPGGRAMTRSTMASGA